MREQTLNFEHILNVEDIREENIMRLATGRCPCWEN